MLDRLLTLPRLLATDNGEAGIPALVQTKPQRGAQMNEKLGPAAMASAGALVLLVSIRQYPMKQKCQQAQQTIHLARMLPPVPEIMLKIVAVIL